jgi:hypothetical protein
MWKEGILPDLNAKGVQLDALKNLRILAFVWFFYFFIVKIN